jgi:nitrate/nitrite-specific signal transduction histidine kinase
MFRLDAIVNSAFYGDVARLCDLSREQGASSGQSPTGGQMLLGGQGTSRQRVMLGKQMDSGGDTLADGQARSAYLVDSSGRVIYHSDPARMGDDFSAQAAVEQVLGGKAGALRARDLMGRDIVASYAPVPGTSWGLVSEETWDALTRESRDNQQLLLVLLVLGVAIPTLVVAVGVRRITNPIEALIAAAQQVAEGRFDTAITARTGDEIEELADQFNAMAAQLQASYAQLERRVSDQTKELAALNAIASVVSQSLDLDEILDDALSKTLEVMGGEAGGIYMLDSQAGALSLAVYRGLLPDTVDAIDGLQIGEGFSGRAAQSMEPLVARDLSDDPRLARLAAQDVGGQSLVSVPLSAKGEALGALFVVAHAGREFSPPDVQFLTSIGHQIGIAIENARHYEQMQTLAVVEERSRLARELHDAVTQTLFSASLIAEVVPDLWSSDPDEGRQMLDELRQLNRGALAEMRTLLLELRPAALVEADLGGLIRQLAEAVSGREGVPVEVTIEGKCRFPDDVHVALYRIAQEALNNVVKHAQARRVVVVLRSSDEDSPNPRLGSTFELCIADDGRGFDQASVPADRLGLGIIRERAQAIGARLQIDTQPGGGTTVRVWAE